MTASTISRRIDLLDRRPCWFDWKERWRNATDEQTCIGLLHHGLRTQVFSAEEESERIQFYLSTADGYLSRSLDMREYLQASKAFDVLADDGYLQDLLDKRLLILPPSTVKAVLHFFRPKNEDEGGGFVNLFVPEGDKGHHRMHKMNDLLLRWCLRVWNRDITFTSEYTSLPQPWQEDKQSRLLLENIRPRILEILYAYGHGQLEKLTDRVLAVDPKDKERFTTRVQWELFTPDCSWKIGELGGRSAHIVGRPTTTGECVRASLVAGSSAAKVATLVWDVQDHLRREKVRKNKKK